MTGEDRTGQDAVYPTRVGMSRYDVIIVDESHSLSHACGNESANGITQEMLAKFIQREWE